MDDLIGRSVLVSCQVQGVFYRASTAREAKNLGLSGWVRNLPEGHVHIEVFGIASKVDMLIAWSKGGPPLAEVSKVEIKGIPVRKEEGFRVAY